MIKNTLNDVSNDIFHYLTKKTKFHKGLLVKKHSENLQRHGEISFPNTLKSWHECIELGNSHEGSDITLLEYLQKDSADIVQESKCWHLEMSKVVVEKSRVYLFLNRPKCVNIGLMEALKNISALSHKIQGNSETFVLSVNLSEEKNSLTSLRANCLMAALQKICKISIKYREQSHRINVTTRQKNTDPCTILCGAVLNAKTGGKETNIMADDYIRMRQNEMTLIAQHKYGMRVTTEERWKDFVAHLGESAVVFELLQNKPKSAVKINFECSSAGSSKGAAFILYNCARLETIIKTYSEKVDEGTYPSLPVFEHTDFSLLTQEDEWYLIYNFIMGFPSMLESCLEVDEKSCKFRPHLICGFLCSMVRVISQYYRKIRILTEPRKHLLPVLFARLHMLKILNDTLKTCLIMLNIKSVSQMYYMFLLFQHSNVFRVPYLKRKKRNPYRITFLSVCPSVKTLYLGNAWRYRVEIKTIYLGLRSLEAVKLLSQRKKKDTAV